jgi:hypothetical protein
MEIPKAWVVQMLRDRGDHDRAQRADQQLPARVDPSRHWDLLARLGIGPRDLPGRVGAKFGL